MWPFHRSAESRMHHRLLERLREAYVVGEDLRTHRLIDDNLRRVTDASQAAKDDPVLYQHWFGAPTPDGLSLALTVEQGLWFTLGVRLHELKKQGLLPDAFSWEAEHLKPIANDLQRALHLAMQLVARAPTHTEIALLQELKARPA